MTQPPHCQAGLFPTSAKTSPLPLWKASALLLAAHCGSGLVLGLLMGRDPFALVVQVIQAVLVGGIVFAWATLDARVQGKRLGTSQRVCLVVFPYLAIPFYLARYRASKAWPRWLGKGALVLFVCFFSFLIAATLGLLVAAVFRGIA